MNRKLCPSLNYLEDFKDGSEYTLRYLVEEYKESLQKQPTKEYLKKNKSLTSANYSNESIDQKEGPKLIKRRLSYQDNLNLKSTTCYSIRNSRRLTVNFFNNTTEMCSRIKFMYTPLFVVYDIIQFHSR